MGPARGLVSIVSPLADLDRKGATREPRSNPVDKTEHGQNPPVYASGEKEENGCSMASQEAGNEAAVARRVTISFSITGLWSRALAASMSTFARLLMLFLVPTLRGT